MQHSTDRASGLVLVADKLMKHLAVLDFIACFSPVFLLAADFALLKVFGATLIPYGIFDTNGYLLAAFLGIVLLALPMVEIKPRVIGHDATTPANTSWSSMPPSLNTTDRLMESYFMKRKSGEPVWLVLVFVGLEMPAMFLFGTLVALTIYKNYLQTIMFG
jgi:hypothetical protein